MSQTPASLHPGFRIVRAPRFFDPSPWRGRILVNSGVEVVDGRYFPRPDWRRPTGAEIERLAPSDGGEGGLEGSGAPLRTEDFALFSIPEHLRARWWSLAGAEVGGSGEDASGRYARLVGDVAEFLRFKGIPLPPACAFDVIVAEAGRPSTRLGLDGSRLAGLGFNIDPVSPFPIVDEEARGRVLGGINLDDEETAVVFVNLPASGMEDFLAGGGEAPPEDATLGGLARHFFRHSPSYPLIRVALRRGEGYWLPAGGIVFDGYPLEKATIEVLLAIRHEGAGAP